MESKKMTKPIVDGEVLGKKNDGLPNTKYMIAEQMPKPYTATIKSDTASPITTDARGRLATDKYAFTGRKRGPVVTRKEVISEPIIGRFFNWIKSVLPQPKIIKTGPRQYKKPLIITPMTNIQSRIAMNMAASRAAQARSYRHTWGPWTISRRIPRPVVPQYKVASQSTGQSMGLSKDASMVQRKLTMKQKRKTAGYGSFMTLPYAGNDAFSIPEWSKYHGVPREEPVSPFYARQMLKG
jgi:hypothetical protein